MEEKINLSAFIEVGNDGLYAVCTDENPFGMIAGFGDSVEEAMADFEECHQEMMKFWEKEGKELPELEFTYRHVNPIG